MDTTTTIIIISIVIILLIVRKLNEKNGLEENYHKNGKLKECGNWKNGKQVGVWKLFYETGKVMLEQTRNENGEVHGITKLYHKNGQLWREEYYDCDNMTSKKCWDKKGNEINCE
jgi:antitoxin component YwqK of YwqJK toxin-antitoxin module